MKIFTLPMGPLQANCYVLADEKSGEGAVIDPGAFDEKLLDLIDNEGINIKYILLTHGHFDHILGAAPLKTALNVPIAIHALDAACLEDEKISLADCEVPGTQEYTKADILLNDGDELTLGGVTVKVLHTPGHTPGGVCYLCGDAMFSGDTLFCRTVGRTDLPGGDHSSLEESCKRLALLDGDYKVFPGHNRPTLLSEERVKNRYLRRLDLGEKI